jgi:hypothetical protein
MFPIWTSFRRSSTWVKCPRRCTVIGASVEREPHGTAANDQSCDLSYSDLLTIAKHGGLLNICMNLAETKISTEYGRYRRRLFKTVCERCNAPFWRPKSRDRKYCSMECAAESRRIERISVECSNCGCTILRRASRLKLPRHGLFFCGGSAKMRDNGGMVVAPGFNLDTTVPARIVKKHYGGRKNVWTAPKNGCICCWRIIRMATMATMTTTIWSLFAEPAT